MKFSLNVKHVSDQASSLLKFHKKFSRFFQTKTRSMEEVALDYMKGLLLVETEKTMAQMERRIDDVCKQKLSHFISQSPWEDEPLVQAIQEEVVSIFNPSRLEDAALIIDESANAKKGKKSVGVKRQYAGSLGKIDNCQVGVYLAYATRSYTSLISRSLYLPKEWVDDPERCFDARIPIEKQVFKTKAEIALELIDQAIENKVSFAFIHMDAHYGNQPALLEAFEERRITWFADVAKSTLVFEAMPKLSMEQMNEDSFQLIPFVKK